MRLASIRVGDLVQVRKPDKLFVAEVTSRGGGDMPLGIKPIIHDPRYPNNYRSASSQEVVAHWRKKHG